MSAVVFLDTETTSLRVSDGEIWEFAAIRVGEDGVETRTWFQIECDLGEADSFSLSIGKYHERFGVNGIWDIFDFNGNRQKQEFPQDGQVVTSKYEAASLIEKFTRGAHIVGNVISFDSTRLENLLRSHGQCPGWHYHVIDIEPMIVGYLLGQNKVKQDEMNHDALLLTLPYKSDALSLAIGVEPPSKEERHTALGDAEWVQRQWNAVVFG